MLARHQRRSVLPPPLLLLLLAAPMRHRGGGINTAMAAHSANHHQILVQHAWHRFEERGDWSDWEATWASVDHDGDGNVRVNHGEVIQLFKRHYNILHERLDHDSRPESGLTRATDATFAREAEDFLHFREKRTGTRHHHHAIRCDTPFAVLAVCAAAAWRTHALAVTLLRRAVKAVRPCGMLRPCLCIRVCMAAGRSSKRRWETSWHT
jgi:hypothetical protein